MHFMLGLTVFVLVWLRLFARSLGPAPKSSRPRRGGRRCWRRLMHWALYLFMISMPILGWLITSAKGIR
jgi:cytochrome b561